MGSEKNPVAREEVFGIHGNARPSPLGRLGMVLRVIEGGESVARVGMRPVDR